MHKDRRHASWLSRWMRPRAPSLRDDPADYGTAFGLEMSVAPVDPQSPATPPAPVVPAVPAAGRWWSRRRRRGA